MHGVSLNNGSGAHLNVGSVTRVGGKGRRHLLPSKDGLFGSHCLHHFSGEHSDLYYWSGDEGIGFGSGRGKVISTVGPGAAGVNIGTTAAAFRGSSTKVSAISTIDNVPAISTIDNVSSISTTDNVPAISRFSAIDSVSAIGFCSRHTSINASISGTSGGVSNA